MNNVENSLKNTPIQQPHIFRKVIGKTVYEVSVHFSQTSKETMTDKVRRLIQNDILSENEENMKKYHKYP